MKKWIYLLLCFFVLAGSYSSLTAAEAERKGFYLNATSRVDTVWATAYQVVVTLTNTYTMPTATWKATFSLPEGYVLSSHVSSGKFSVSGQKVTVNSLSTNGVILPGASTTFTMIINMPLSGKTVINSLQAYASASTAPSNPPTAPNAPALNAIATPVNQDYTISWANAASATSYTLEEDTSSDFMTPEVVAQGNILSKVFNDKPVGTYFYRVKAANAVGESPYSNIQSVIVSDDREPPSNELGVEHSAWYIDWTAWFDGPPFVIPSGNDVLNIFVGQIYYDSNNQPAIGGFGTFTLPQIDAFTAYCAAQQPPISVKVSIGGAGGMYDRCWDVLTSANVGAFAQAMANFCHAHNIAGVDFDYESFVSTEQEILVGQLIKAFKAIDSSLKTSLCTNAGFGPNFPWQAHVKTILDAATIAPNNCAVDRVYIMSYYDPIELEKGWVLGWANWLKTEYGFTNARVSVGIDDFDAHAYDPVEFSSWAKSQGFSTAHWAFDPARPK